MKGAQIGGTECGNNWIGYIVDHAPGPLMAVMPRVEDAKKNSKIRLDPLFESCPRLRDKIKQRKTKESDNTILQKGFPGGYLILTGANSAAGLRSVPCRYLFLDEVDEYPGDVEGQGDPINLAKKRQSTFSKKKSFLCSTPTIENRSRIEFAYDQTDKRKYFVPCPHCKHMQVLIWAQIKWEKGKPETVRYECESCKGQIENWQKTDMLAKGEWRATAEGSNKKVVGFHLSALYSPVGWFSWESCVRDWEEAQKDKNQEKLKTFINTTLGETWKDKGEAPEWKRLYDRRELYKQNELPNGVCFLTAGVDVQKGRLEVEIVGWGRNKKSWSIDYRIFHGDTSNKDSEAWRSLSLLLGEFWQTSGGQDLSIKQMAVDTGYNTQTVYSWCEQYPSTQVMAVKGNDSQSVIIGKFSLVGVTRRGKKIKRGLKLFPIGVSILKSELYGWLKAETPDEDAPEPYGFCHFPQYDEEFFRQLTAEEMSTKLIRGFKKYEWNKTRDRNEALDCRIYARVAAAMFGIDRLRDDHWNRLEEDARVNLKQAEAKTGQENEEKTDNLPKYRQKIKIKRRKSNFM